MTLTKELFGVETGENFYIKHSYEETYTKDKYHFNNKGYLIKENGHCSYINLFQITRGCLVIVKISK